MARNTETITTSRKAYLDIARTFAIIFVIMNHAVNRSFIITGGYQVEYQILPWYYNVFKTVAYIFSRVGVPFFLYISGALLLGRDYDREYLRRFFRNNWLRLFITTEIWLAIMFWYKQWFPDSILRIYGVRECISRFFKTLLFIDPVSMGSMWYMYMILCLYLIIPVFAVALKRLDRRYILLIMLVAANSSMILYDINGLSAAREEGTVITSSLDAYYSISHYAIYMILGYMIEDGLLDRVHTLVVAGVSVVFFSLIFLLQYRIFASSWDYYYMDSYRSMLLLLFTASVFELLRRGRYREGPLMRVFSDMSSIFFGIYFLHICIMEWLNLRLTEMNIIYIRRFMILAGASLVGSIIIIAITKYIPFCRKWLYRMK